MEQLASAADPDEAAAFAGTVFRAHCSDCTEATAVPTLGQRASRVFQTSPMAGTSRGLAIPHTRDVQQHHLDHVQRYGVRTCKSADC